MVKVTRSTVINAPISAVWNVLRNFNDHDRWHPAVRQSHIENSLYADQVGAIRNFQLTGGERVREQLLTLSDQKHSFRYRIIESDVPLQNYTAEVSLRSVTDRDRTFWSWSSRFETPAGLEQDMTNLVAEGVYEAGFEAVRSLVESPDSMMKSVPTQAPASETVSGSAMVVGRYGGPEVFRMESISAPPPDAGQVRIRQQAIGVNYIDVYCRTGYFRLLDPPGVLGMEAAGEVIDVGEGVTHLSPGQRVAYACLPIGAYTTVRTMDSGLVVPLPDTIDDVTAAGGLLKGMTAEFLLHRVHPVSAGETVLVYAPAGGVGSLLCQWASHLGATVIGATSSPEKVQAALDAGAHHVITPSESSLVEQVLELTGGQGADVIYDAVGHDSFAHSVAALADCGHLISYGQASGDIGNWDIGSLALKSATVSRPNYAHYTDSREKVTSITHRLFDAIERGIVRVNVHHRHDLQQVAEAHRALQERRTTGSIVLLPKHSSEIMV